MTESIWNLIPVTLILYALKQGLSACDILLDDCGPINMSLLTPKHGIFDGSPIISSNYMQL